MRVITIPQNKINLDLVNKNATKLLLEHFQEQVKPNAMIEINQLIPFPDRELRLKTRLGLTYMSLISRYISDSGYFIKKSNNWFLSNYGFENMKTTYHE